jgi:hypothetical protein
MEESDLLGAVLKLIEEGGPARAPRAATAFVARTCRCETAALFAEDDGALRLVTSYQIDQAGIDAVNASWGTARRRLRAGERFATPRFVLVPLLLAGEFVGLFFLRTDAPTLGPLNLPAFMPFWDLLARLVHTPATETEEWTAAIHGTPEDLERQQLVYLCEQHEWNLSRVARAKGVSRPTIYAWMKRLGIDRKPHALEANT